MKKIAVLGAGMVGSAMAGDLSKNFNVLSIDVNQQNLNKAKKKFNIQIINADLSDDLTIKNLVKDFDLVISAVPGFMGFNTLKSIIESKKDVVDISFFSEDPFELDELAKKNNVTAVVDCGVAPGMSNVILGYHNANMKINSYECYVGGLPFERDWPFQYKAPFSPVDVIEEYIRPARLVENGKIIIRPALSEPELMDFERVGTLESFNSDGLRSLITTMKIPDMKEKTLRYPGHVELMRIFRETGFFSSEKMEIKGVEVSPLDVTSKLLFPLWKAKENEPEFTVMRIIIKGEEKEITYTLFDEFDQNTKTSSMARTTGYTASAAANLLLNGMYNKKGIIPPEYLGVKKEWFNYFMDYMKLRNINYIRTVRSLKNV